MIRSFAATLLISLALVGGAAVTLVGAAAPALAQVQRPDTEFCAKMRAKDPGGICMPKGEYVTAEKVYFPDGRIVNRTTGG